MTFNRSIVREGAAIVAVAALLASGLTTPAGAQSTITVTVDGNAVDFSPAPIIQAGRVFVPLRGVFERLGASVVYSAGTINATGGGRDIALAIGSTQATVNGQPETIDVAPFIIGASTYVPLRFISESLGASVNWDESDDVVSIATVGGSTAYVPPVDETNYGYADAPPPPLPQYEQPYVPEPDYLWQPGYWAWGPYGYYWVPGTWVAAPQPGYLWTPGYWHYNDGAGNYAWSPGFWATAIGFYGGVNYGFGFFGNGYDGGEWSGDRFRYNTYVTRVDTTNTTIINNTYVNRNVTIVNNEAARVSYDGGAHGLAARPTIEQQAVGRQQHLPMTAVQVQHLRVASQDRRLLATVNHARPPVLAVARPLSSDAKPEGFVPVRSTDRVNAQSHTVPVAKPAPVYRTPAPAPAYRAPVAKPAPVYHAPAPVYRAPAPTYHVAPHPAAAVHRAPAPVYHAPAPAYHAPAPAYHAAPHPAAHAPPPRPAARPAAPHPRPTEKTDRP